MAKIERLCFITALNPGGVSLYFTNAFADAWRRQGVEVLVLELRAPAFLDREKLEQLTSWNPTLTCSFNSLLPLSGGLFFFDVLKIPYWGITVDPAPYRFPLTKSPYAIISCSDYRDCEFMESLGFKRSFFLPHGFPANLSEYEEEERPYDIVMVGSCHDYEEWRSLWIDRLPPLEQKILDDAIEMADVEPLTPYVDLLSLSLLSNKFEPSDGKFRELFHFLHCYLRSRARVNLMRSIRHLPVHIFGEATKKEFPNLRGWQDYLSDQDNITFHPKMAIWEMAAVLRKSKISLNSTPFFRNGSHERLFESMACGAVAVTSENIWTRKVFKVDEELLIYNEQLPKGELENTLSLLLNDEPRRLTIAERGRKAALNDHTWDARVTSAISYFETIELPKKG